MKITVLGANGKVGQLVVQKLLAEGHDVVAFVHRNKSFEINPKLTFATGDVHKGEDVMNALTGSNAVISCLGSWHTAEKNILSSAIQNVIPAMRKNGITRIITLTGANAFIPSDKPTVLDKTVHTLLNTVAPKVLRDSEDHMQLLANSGVDWTVLRSPIMTDTGSTAYILKNTLSKPWETVHREAVANCLIDLLKTGKHNHEAPIIARTDITIPRQTEVKPV